MNSTLKLAPTTTRYVVSRPVNAHKSLPVHVNRVTNFQKFEYDEQNKPYVKDRVRETWIGSFPTEELAQGAINIDKSRRADDVG